MTFRSTWLPQLAAKSISLDEAERLIEADALQWEIKHDGIRCVLTNGGIFNRNMEPLTKPVPTAVRSYAAGLPDAVFLDGELVGEMFHAFDLILLGQRHDQGTRSELLRGFLRLHPHPANIQQGEVAITAEHKRLMLDRVRTESLEGVMLKHRHRPHVSGRSEGWTKAKNTATVDCVVAKIHTDREACDLAVFRPSGIPGALPVPVVIGTASRLGKGVLNLGMVVEVEYLYMGAGGRLVQPRIKRTRTDKPPFDCTVDQLKDEGRKP